MLLTPRLLLALRVSGWTLLAALVTAALDAGLGVQLPQPLRAAVPWVLVGSLLVWLTLLSGALGMPKKPVAPTDAAPDARAR